MTNDIFYGQHKSWNDGMNGEEKKRTSPSSYPSASSPSKSFVCPPCPESVRSFIHSARYEHSITSHTIPHHTRQRPPTARPFKFVSKRPIKASKDSRKYRGKRRTMEEQRVVRLRVPHEPLHRAILHPSTNPKQTQSVFSELRDFALAFIYHIKANKGEERGG